MDNEYKSYLTNNVSQRRQLLPILNIHSKSILFYGGVLDIHILEKYFKSLKLRCYIFVTFFHFAKNIYTHFSHLMVPIIIANFY